MKKHGEEMKTVSDAFQKQLNEKDDYIRMLEQIIEGEASGLMMSTDKSSNAASVHSTFCPGRTAEFSRDRHPNPSNVAPP